jgi:serine/threonine-protein kinase
MRSSWSHLATRATPQPGRIEAFEQSSGKLCYSGSVMARALPQPGEIIAEKYLVTGLIGRGGMGAVYVVEHRITGKRLAVKCLLPEHTEHPDLVERFLREAQAAGRIQHRYVVDVFDVGQDGELLYIVMELIDGKQLNDVLRESPLPAEEVLVVLLRAMEGVAAAHAEGIVHRDLKPENILVCRGPSGKQDDPRVLDFGISKLEEDARSPLTKSGMMMGTPYYMSFEQINSQRDLDQRVDVYAMGVILYEALSGRVPYLAESVGALAVRMMSGPPASLAELRPDLAPQLVDVVMRAIAKERDERYPTMQALIEALTPFAAVESGHTPARGSLRMRENAAGTASLRLSFGDAQTLHGQGARSTPARDGLHVDEDDESARPPTGAHSSPVGKLMLAAIALLIAVTAGIVLWRRSATSVDASEAGAPASAAPSVPATPEGPLPASAEPLKRVEAVMADAAIPAEQRAEEVLKAAQPEPEEEVEEEEAPTRGRKGVKKRVVKKTKRGEQRSLDQMVPKAPELPAEEREAAPAPAAEPAREEPAPAPAPAAAPEPPPAEPPAP